MSTAYSSFAHTASSQARASFRSLELTNAHSQIRIAKLLRKLGDREAQVEELVDMIRFLRTRNADLLEEMEDYATLQVVESPLLALEAVGPDVASLAITTLDLCQSDHCAVVEELQALTRCQEAIISEQAHSTQNMVDTLLDDSSSVISVETHLMTLFTRLQTTQSQLASTASEVHILEARLSAAEHNLDERSVQADELRNRVDEAHGEAVEAQECLAIEREEVGRLRRDCSAKESKISQLTKQRNSAKDTEDHLRTQVARFVFNDEV